MPQITVLEFENAVWRIDEVLIRIRAPESSKVGDYDYDRKASRSMTLSNWLNARIYPKLGDLEVSIIDGYFRHPHGSTKMRNLRDTYVDWQD